MDSRGLVARRPCPTDQRSSFVVLTPAGRQAIEACARAHVADVREVLVDHAEPARPATICEFADLVRDRVETLQGRPEGRG